MSEGKNERRMQMNGKWRGERRNEKVIFIDSLGPSTSAKAMEQGEARVSPPKAIVDSSPLQSAMDKNRECELWLQLFANQE